MGTFAETAIIDYHLLFADQEKQTSVFRFRGQQTDGSLSFPLIDCSKQTATVFSYFRFRLGNFGNMETWRHGNIETWKHGDIDMEK